MSRGLGTTQRRILAALGATADQTLTVMQLAEQLERSDRQIRHAVHALADRGLVRIFKENGGFAGLGVYGPLRQRWGLGPEVPTAEVRHQWIDDLVEDDNGEPTGETFLRRCRVEYVHAGMPTGATLFVSLPREPLPAEAVAADHKLSRST